MDGVGRGARLGGQDPGEIAAERHGRNALSGEDPGVGRAHPVSVHDPGDVDQPDVVDVMGLGVAHGTGDGLVQRGQHDLRRGRRGAGVGLEGRADEVRAGVRVHGSVGDLCRLGNGLVVVEDRHRLGGGRQLLDRGGQAGPHGGQLLGDLGGHRAVAHAGVAEADVEAQHPDQLVLEAGGKVDVVGPGLDQHEPRRVLGAGPAAATSSARLRVSCGGRGHCVSRAVLSAASATAPLMDS